MKSLRKDFVLDNELYKSSKLEKDILLKVRLKNIDLFIYRQQVCFL